MSAFLGPIHVKMYDRILAQDEISKALLALAEEKDWACNLRELANAKAPAASTAPLSEIIDPGNIHGWLHDAVARCEHRFALIAGSILAGHPERLTDLKRMVKSFGHKCKVPTPCNAEQAFQAIHDILLDGMPCDFPFQITETSAGEVAWQVGNCPHAPFWEAVNCDVEIYYLLRDAWVDGALEDSGIAHSRAAGSHTLRKRS